MRHTIDALQRAHWAWLVPAAGAAAVTYVMAAVAVTAASGLALPIGQTTLVQLACSVANRLAPGGLGGAATNVRYLQRSGLERFRAVAAVALTSAVGFVVHGVGLVAVAVAVAGHGVGPRPPLANRWTVLVLVAGSLAAAGIVVRTPIGRQRLRPAVMDAARGFGEVLGQPRRALLLVVAAAGIANGYILALAAVLQAFAGNASLVTVAAAYLAAGAIGAASPTPGGLGAVKPALVAALTRLGVAGGRAISGVLVFRLVTYWLPVLPGVVAVRVLRNRQAL